MCLCTQASQLCQQTVAGRLKNSQQQIAQGIAPGAARRYAPPPMAVRRWHIVSPSIRPSASVRGSKKSPRIYVRPRTGPQSAHLWWLSCRQPACRMPIAYRAAAPRDRRADRAVPKCPLGRGIIRWSVSPANVQTVQSIAAVAPTF